MAVGLPLNPEVLETFCRRHGVRKLSLFGSVLKGTDRPDSDVDLLVEFEPEARPTLLDLAAMEEELARLLGGRRVDLCSGRSETDPPGRRETDPPRVELRRLPLLGRAA